MIKIETSYGLVYSRCDHILDTQKDETSLLIWNRELFNYLLFIDDFKLQRRSEIEIQKRRSNKHKKGYDWGSWDDIWNNCRVLTLTKGKDEECEEITMENSGLIIG